MQMILFRGKRIDTGEWIEGGYFLEPYVRRIYIVCWNTFGLGFAEHIAVYPHTVGQYTGLKDRNDVRIFEGDIIKIPDDYDQFGHNAGERYEVIFQFGGFRLKPKYGRNAKGYWLEDDATVEVIGNIHDNPELLEAQS